jgi:hypothetical protein
VGGKENCRKNSGLLAPEAVVANSQQKKALKQRFSALEAVVANSQQKKALKQRFSVFVRLRSGELLFL